MFVFEIFLLSLFFFIHFPVFLTQVYRFYRNFLVFHFFHLFSAFLFYATAFLLNFIDYFPEHFWRLLQSFFTSYLWLQLNSCIHFCTLFICSNVFFTSLLRNYFRHWGGYTNFSFQYILFICLRYLLFYIHCFGFWHKSIDIFANC